MIYNSNPYKRKMESMQVNVAPSVPNHTDKPTTKQVLAQETIPDPVPPVEQSVPPIEITPYVPEVEGVEVPTISLEDIEPTTPATEVIEEVAVDNGELSNPEQAEEVVETQPTEETETPAIHYFYCTKPDGKETVYKRNTTSASYESEVASFRKYLEKEGIIINREEIK